MSHKWNTPKRLSGLILCLALQGIWKSSRRGGFRRLWSVWRLWPIWRLWCWGGWVRVRRRRWRRWGRRSVVLLLGREHRLHGASHGFLWYCPHHHLRSLHHRLQLPQSTWSLMCFVSPRCSLVSARRFHAGCLTIPLHPSGPSGYLQEREGTGQKTGVWWTLCHWAAWRRRHQGPVGQTGAQHSVR